MTVGAYLEYRYVAAVAAVLLPGVQAGPADHVDDALRVGRNGEGDREFLVALAQGAGGQNDDLVRRERSGLMALGAAHDDAVFPFLDHVEVHILVRLLLGAEVPVPLDVGHPGVGHEVVLLHVLQELDEPLVVLGPVLLVDVVGRHRQGDHAVLARAPLEAGADALAQQAVDLDPGHQVLDRLRAGC